MANLFDIPTVTINVSTYKDLIRKEKAYEKIREYLVTCKDGFVDKEFIKLLADINENAKESSDEK
jgi:hypothetical protein